MAEQAPLCNNRFTILLAMLLTFAFFAIWPDSFLNGANPAYELYFLLSVILIKFFFSEGIATDDGEEVSSREVKRILKDAIEAEDKHKPLPDEKLMEILKDKGYNIARRTVAKYREQLNIPVARLRKEV